MTREKIKIAHNADISMNDGVFTIEMPMEAIYNSIVKHGEQAEKVEEIILTIPNNDIRIFGIPVRFVPIEDNNIIN